MNEQWRTGDIMEILEVGGKFFATPEEDARVNVPRLLQLIDPQHIAEAPEAGIGRDTGVNSEEKRQVISRDTSSRMAQRNAGTPRSGGRRGASHTDGSPSIDRPAPGGSRRERMHRKGGVPHSERPAAS